MKKTLCIVIAIICVFSFSIFIFAHSGRTDANGGHYDRSTGEYHYHNGNSVNETTTKNNNGIDWDYYKDKAQKLDKEEYQKIIGENKDNETTTKKTFEETFAERDFDNKLKFKDINSLIYTFRIITWPLVMSFFLTIGLMFIIYGVYESITKRYMSDKLALAVSTIIFLIIAVLIYKGFTENHIIDYYNSFSFSFSDFGDIIFILIYSTFAFFGSGLIMVILSELTPLFDKNKYKSKKVYNFIFIIVFIVLFVALFDFFQYHKIFN